MLAYTWLPAIVLAGQESKRKGHASYALRSRRRLDHFSCQHRSQLSSLLSLLSLLSLPPPRHAPAWRMPRNIGTPNASSTQTEARREWTRKLARTRTWHCVDGQAPFCRLGRGIIIRRWAALAVVISRRVPSRPRE